MPRGDFAFEAVAACVLLDKPSTEMRLARAIAGNRPEVSHRKPIRIKGIEFPVSIINFDPLQINVATDMHDVGRQ